MPEISVIVPVYNVEKYLRRCLDSIIFQSFSDFDVLLIDDGSFDESGEICDEYANRDRRITVIHKNNEGQAITRNKGIEWCLKNSSSKWIAFVDSDDWLHKKYFEMLYNAAILNKTDISACDYIRTSEKSEDVFCDRYEFEIIGTEEFFMQKNVLSVIPWGKLYRKYLFENVRFPAVKLYEDEMTLYKILFNFDSIPFVNYPLYYYFDNSNGVTGGVKGLKWNPDTLILIQAFKERTNYFKNKNLDKALIFQLKQYLYHLCDYCKILSKTENQEYKKKYLPYFRCELRRFIKENKKLMDLSFKKEKWIYELAYPRLTHLYWVTAGRLNNKQ